MNFLKILVNPNISTPEKSSSQFTAYQTNYPDFGANYSLVIVDQEKTFKITIKTIQGILLCIFYF